jgi:hypothetical protein
MKAEDLVKGLGHPRFLFMGLAKKSWPKIVVDIREIWEVERLP